MKIKDRRHDYYDIGMGLGHDSSIVYVREPKEIEYPKWSKPYKANWRFDSIYVGFCGKIYPAFAINVPEGNKTITHVCYTIEEVDKFVHTYLKKDNIEVYETESRDSVFKRFNLRYSSSNIFQPYWNRKSILVGLEKMKEASHYVKLFAEHNCPIFVVDPPENKIHVNCLLKPWEFYKVFDPYTAFQEISMYVSGVLLAPVNPVPDIPDDTMRDIKGFDHWSFRKEPKEK